MSLNAHVQRAGLGALVTLFDIDLTPIGGEVLRIAPQPFTSGQISQAVQWRGNTYQPHPCQADGWDWDGEGPMPTPTFTVANVDLSFTTANIQYDNLRGAVLTRWRTFDRYLDNAPTADPNQHFEPDVFTLNTKSTQNKLLVTYELASAIDFVAKLLPARQCLKTACPWRYRRYDTNLGQFDYTNATCPYTGGDMFTRTGAPTVNPANDICGKRLSDCKKRFKDTPLGFGGFPGLDAYRV